MNLFAEEDRQQLVAPAALFDREGLIDEHGQWGHQLLRAATAMETLAQVSKILVETGIKEPDEVEARYWDWEETTAREAAT